MPRLLLLVGAATTFVAASYATYMFGFSKRHTAAENEQQAVTVNLAGLGTVNLAPSFKPVAPGGTGPNAKGGFDPASVEFHTNERLITFRFEQDQSNNMGGYSKNPVLLNVTLFNPALPSSEVLKIGGTTVSQFYPPVDDQARLKAHFDAQAWNPDITNGEQLTRSAETNSGRGDNLSSSPPERWLIIHADGARHVRVDIYTWQKKYSLDEARALAKQVAESFKPAPTVQSFFDNVKTVGARTENKHDAAVARALSLIKACGIESLRPGEVTLKGECGAWLSESRRDLHVMRAMGRVPLTSAKIEPNWAPQFQTTPLPGPKPAFMIGPPDFLAGVFYWDAKINAFKLDGFGEQMYDDDARVSPLSKAIITKLTDKASAHAVTIACYDLQFHADRVAITEFFAESDRMKRALLEGSFVKGVKATPFAFD